MNWIDEKVGEFDALLTDEYGKWKIGRIEGAKFLRTALADAHQRGVEEERKRVLEWAKVEAVEMDWGGFVKAIPLDNLINFINKS